MVQGKTSKCTLAAIEVGSGNPDLGKYDTQVRTCVPLWFAGFRVQQTECISRFLVNLQKWSLARKNRGGVVGKRNYMATEMDIKQVFGRRIKRVIVSGVSGALVWRLRSCPQLPA